MSATEIRAGRAYVELGTKDASIKSGLAKAGAMLSTFGASITQIGMGFAKLGLAMLVPLGFAARTFAGFEKSMARVHALTNATDKDFAMLSDRARQLGRDTVFMASDAADAMAFFALAGFKVNEIMGAVGPTMDLAAVGMMEVKDAADIMAKVIRGMGLDVNESAKAVDIMAKAMTTANTDLPMLGEAFKYVGPIAKSAGITFEEVTAAIQLLSNAGIQGQMAGTTLRGLFLEMVNPETLAKLDAMGVKVMDAMGNTREFASVVDDFKRSLEGLGSAEKLAKIGSIFDKRQAAGFAVLVDQGGDKLREFTEELKDSGGTAKRIADTQLNTVWGMFKLIGSSLEGVAIELGEAIMPVLRIVGEELVKWLNAGALWIKENQMIVGVLASVGAALTLMGGALVGVGLLIGAVGSAMTAFATLASSAAGMVSGAWAFLVHEFSFYFLTFKGLMIQAAKWILYLLPPVREVEHWLLHNLWHSAEIFAEHFVETWKGMGDAMRAGDLKLAAEVAMAGVTSAILEGTLEWRIKLVEFQDAFMAVWDILGESATAAIKDISGAWDAMFAGFKAVSDWYGWDKMFGAGVEPAPDPQQAGGDLAEAFAKRNKLMNDLLQEQGIAPIQGPAKSKLELEIEKMRHETEEERNRLKELVERAAAKSKNKAALDWLFQGAKAVDKKRFGPGGEPPDLADANDLKRAVVGSYSGAVAARNFGGMKSPEAKLLEQIKKIMEIDNRINERQLEELMKDKRVRFA